MKKLVFLSLVLAGCVTSDPNPIATTLQEAEGKSDYFICDAQTRGGKYENEVISARKLNCKKIIEAEIRAQLAASPSSTVC